MTALTACPICQTPRPADRASDQPWCCSIACYRAFHGINQPRTPSCHDAVTNTCPTCGRSLTPIGRQTYCTAACRAAAYRRRRHAHPPPVVVPKAQPRRPITIYECDSCGARALGEQHCRECRTFMRRVGIGGCCPACDEPIALTELLDQQP
jgi:hypothetical protein